MLSHRGRLLVQGLFRRDPHVWLPPIDSGAIAEIVAAANNCPDSVSITRHRDTTVVCSSMKIPVKIGLRLGQRLSAA